ncbi:MAG TPA: aquaporin, partial [Ruminococcaceae bacterium]|nr:aquaporin [Oscillospiraceae bacterium]
YMLVFAIVVSIGMSLGGLTGYAMNPARDLGPRIAHSILPIKNKGTSDWHYGLIVPVWGPIVGSLLGALLFRAIPW